ncbi:hypothetical protein ACFQY5_15940 [Paeniroseomonas aquatica]|uniref:Uncharacterized protein n=1 Tax=Paeniroseomonas aquatica TaxID=373043 RepID=A0ABT8A7I3_9PROT|nr:hypothetical protein [Paeniroseomonas aquatica]MDN3565656.1 hypothetical protein [Paeniroseomonas aquatica]
MRLLFMFPVIALAACTVPGTDGPAEADLAAVRQVSMSGPSLSWQELRIHPTLMRRACAVSTLVNEDGQTVGYCVGGRQCRTNDWRPIEPGCNRSPEYRAGPISTPPATPAVAPAGPPAAVPAGPTMDIARIR